ncbi:MAG: hypothetical protein OEU36_18180, partial [Gammaproteobacteria bacterium]|nr:hypothetical protein [Gammaproteobacteria bacterium]
MTAVCQSINTGARNPLLGFVAWLLNDPRRLEHLSETERQALDPVRVAAFVVMHIACLSVLWVGASWVAIFAALIFYALRMFFVTAFYHRYFSHRAFKTSRWFQFAMATAGCTAGQRGPVWWASHHREHHSHADTPS